MAWIAPKTDWMLGRFFNIVDYARITGNLQTTWDFASAMRYELGSPIIMATLDYAGIPSKDVFNAVERNLESLANKTYKPSDYTNGRIFVGDGNDKTWTYDELNRIENLTSEIYTGLVLADAGAPYTAQYNFYCGSLYL
jgi:hypothetical protein